MRNIKIKLFDLTDEGIQITGPISVIRSDQSNGRVTGAIWGRDTSISRELPDA